MQMVDYWGRRISEKKGKNCRNRCDPISSTLVSGIADK